MSMTFDAQPFGDTTAISLLYNYVIRTKPADPLPVGQVARPLNEGEELVLHGMYQENSGYVTRMTSAFLERGGEQRHGFYFRGDNGVAYRKDGSTELGGGRGVNDIVAIIETSKPQE